MAEEHDGPVIAGESDAAPNAEGVIRRRRRRKGPRRDTLGRFAKRRGRIRKPSVRGTGIRGQSHYADKTPLELARMLGKIEHQIGHLEAETRCDTWSDPERQEVAWLSVRHADQKAEVKRRLQALDLVLHDMSLERLPRDTPKMHELIAERVQAQLRKTEPDATFSVSSLYRKPYFGAWQKWRKRKTEDWLGKEEVDDSPLIVERSLWKRRLLVFEIGKRSKVRDELRAKRRDAIASDDVADGWNSIPKPEHAEEPTGDAEVEGEPASASDDQVTAPRGGRGRSGRGPRGSGT